MVSGTEFHYVDFPVEVVADARRSGFSGLRVIAGKTVARTPYTKGFKLGVV